MRKDGTLDESFSISEKLNIANDFGKSWIKGGVVDIVGQYCLWLKETDMRSSGGRKQTLDFFISKWFVKAPDNKREFIKSLASEELLEKFDDFKLNWYKQDISAFLINRWVPYDFIQKNNLLIGEVFSDIWFYDNYYCTEKPTYKDEKTGEWINQEGDKPKTVAVFMFPCLDEFWNRIGMKLRRKDWKTIRGQKSIAVGKTGLLYKTIDSTKPAIIVEWEMDDTILRILWYTNVVGNLWWVQAHKSKLRDLLFETSKVICLYDNDNAGRSSKESLPDIFKRTVHEVVFPIREDKDWTQLTDVNDFYNAGYNTKKKWDKLLSEAKEIGVDVQKTWTTDFIFLRKSLEYYDTKYKTIQQTSSVGNYLWKTGRELSAMVSGKAIIEYENLCYLEGWKENHYNTLDETTIIKHWGDEDAVLHPHIEQLINNISWHKKKNATWIHRAVLYKLTHINDVHLPALVLYGSGGSGKWSFLNLLGEIFWQVNTLVWLGQKDLESGFDSYQWEKLIVEFKEVSSGNTQNDKKILDRIKSFVWEPKMTINPKYSNAREVDNIAWFHLSSNHTVPIQMDSKHSGNRRFTVIKTSWELNHTTAKQMNQITFKDKKVLKQYVNRLYETYPDVPNLTYMSALDNAEKRNLEEACEWVANQFFEWLEKSYPHITRITNIEKNMLLTKYMTEIWEDSFDQRYKQKNFDLWLSHRYEKKAVKVRGKMARWYYINKTDFELDNIPNTVENEFKVWEVEREDGITF